MTLRLSSSSTNPSSVDGYMKQITDDTSISLAQKNDCLKTLTVVLKNLVDASKGGLAGDSGLKYRTLKLDNPKLRAKLFCARSVRDLLTDSKLVGMGSTETTLTMLGAPSPAICDAVHLKVLPCVSTAQRTITSRLQIEAGNNNAHNKRAKLAEHNGSTLQSSSSSSSSPPSQYQPPLTEKQKARVLMEERERIEKERERAFRRETKARIAADKLVRETDENWKPSVSAAADKTGTGLLSFRDRHAEE